MITLEKVKVSLYHKEFLAAIDQVLQSGLRNAGKDFVKGVQSRTPVADAKYLRSGKLRENIRSSNYIDSSGSIVSVTIASQAKSRGRRFYGRFLEYGSATTPAYGMFRRTINNDLNKIILQNIILPLRKIKIK